MDKNEFRIGNLFYPLIGYDNTFIPGPEIHKVLALRVHKIIGVRVECNPEEQKSWPEFSYESVFPIDLTLDWISMAGGEKDASWRFDHKIYTTYRINGESILSEKPIGDDLMRIEERFFYASKRIKYVHKLQNLIFELSGKEIEFKLNQKI